MKEKVLVIDIFDTPTVAVETASEEQFIPIFPICQALGLDLEAELALIKEDDLLKDYLQTFSIPNEKGEEQDTVCIDIHRFYGWILTIGDERVSESGLQQLREYKHICYRVLAAHSKHLFGILGLNIITDNEEEE